ncbi:hypothetical protein PAALTS15_03992 [Paenibacillus alvei TS-15]|uniref:PepSY domain-containing protein n=1 Tax=Paenibacillus alvei TS-15 TaxID=1117108 RepID=S9SVL6_PAEAL|nr:hypothetical protein [Paenibacillus alvei]EPY08704.1 hypothetical protein PAALTS15_03992 [Paenibacillus alvei TS-15]
MNLKKAILATMIVSSMFVTLAGPTFVGAEAAGGKQQEQTSGSSIQVDKKVAANLQKSVNQFAGKEIKLKFENAFKHPFDLATVPSADELYKIDFKPSTGELINIKGIQTLDKVSKDDQKELLNKLKGMYAKKAYAFHKEVQITQRYDKGKVYNTLYLLEGKDFVISWIKYPHEQSKNKNYIGAAVIQVDKNELEPKLLKTAADAVKTALDQEFEVKKAELGYYAGAKGDMWKLKGDHITLAVEAKTGKTEYVYDVARKQADTAVTEKEVKEIAAPIAKKLFHMDIQGLEVKWDKSARDFCFVQNKETKMSVALDADKNVVYMFSGLRMMLEK